MEAFQNEIDEAAIRDFAHDLEGMTKDQIERELDAIADQIDRDTAWQEALAAMLRRHLKTEGRA